MDTRSPAGSAGKNAWVLVLNSNTDLSGRMRRMGGWRRFGWEANSFVNQDFHDQLQQAVVPPPPPECVPPSNVVISQTSSDSTGQVTLALTYTGEVTRIRWYKDDVLIYDSNA